MRRTTPAAWLSAVALSAPAVAQAPLPTFASSSEAVEVDVSVTRDGVPLTGLRAADFEVRDRGRAQAVELVAAGDARLHAVLVLDRSASMAGVKLEQARQAARALLGALRDDDRVSLLAFADRFELVAGPAAERGAAAAALDGLRTSGGTALYDALFAGLLLADTRNGRPVVLILSDGADRFSFLAERDVRDVARETSATLYAVAAAEPPPDPRRGNLAAHEEPWVGRGPRPAPPPTDAPDWTALERLAGETGGRTWRAVLGPDLERAFLDVLADARARYVLRYEPDDLTPGFHELDVRVRRSGARVRARNGYTRPAAR